MNEEAKKNIPPEEIEPTEETLDTVSGGAGIDDIFFATCSNCGKQFATGHRVYCPYCGAEMKEQ